MGDHIDTRSKRAKPIRESDNLERQSRVSFKTYLRELREAEQAEVDSVLSNDRHTEPDNWHLTNGDSE